MTSVSGIVDWSNIQTDGRYVVRETWTDDEGNTYVYNYMNAANVTSPLKYDQAYNDAVAYEAQLAAQQQGGD